MQVCSRRRIPASCTQNPRGTTARLWATSNSATPNRGMKIAVLDSPGAGTHLQRAGDSRHVVQVLRPSE